MSRVYPDSVAYQVYIASAWVDLSLDVIGEDNCAYGISGNGPLDRVASPGSMSITLKNDATCIGGVAGYYTPNKTGALAGWKKGLPILQTISYSGFAFVKRWYIDDITLGTGWNKTVKLKCVDWLEYAANQPIILPSLEFNKRLEEVVASVISYMPIAPQSTTYGTGADTFVTVYDTVRSSTTALSEISKATMSELGYVYLRRDPTTGERLVVEGRHTRTGHDEIVSVPSATTSHILAEDGESMLAEDGGFILADTIDPAIFDNLMDDANVTNGTNLVNYLSAKSYPRKVDAAATTILFTLNYPISIAAGATVTISTRYVDPTGAASQVAGRNMVAPVATTDYLMNAASDGSGADLTANLTVTPIYGANDLYYTLTNTSGTPGFVTKLQARGKGIYIYNPVESISEDTASQNAYGYEPMKIDMKYQQDPDNATATANIILAQQKEPRTMLNKISFLANYSSYTMFLFMSVDIGHMITVMEDQNGINANYYVNKIEYSISGGPTIRVVYTLAESAGLTSNTWLLADAVYGLLGTSTILGY